MAGVLVAVGVTPSSASTVGVCGQWATEADACAPCTDGTDGLADWMLVATDLLYELSGQRFPGVCPDTVQPCATRCAQDGPRIYDDAAAARWSWWGACGCGGGVCGCTTLPELTLSGWPLVTVDAVTIDGELLDPTAYRIDDWSRLVRVDGEQWPACSDDFTIDFTYGVPPPRPGVVAAATLGCQLALACAGDSSCRLPQRVQSITRQGVSMVMLDPFTFFDDGRTGLYDVDLFLAAYGPTAKKRWPAVIANPDTRARVRRITG